MKYTVISLLIATLFGTLQVHAAPVASNDDGYEITNKNAIERRQFGPVLGAVGNTAAEVGVGSILGGTFNGPGAVGNGIVRVAKAIDPTIPDEVGSGGLTFVGKPFGPSFKEALDRANERILLSQPDGTFLPKTKSAIPGQADTFKEMVKGGKRVPIIEVGQNLRPRKNRA
ncbi:uncharacterized protein VTP21DRAFT_2774 [Calcarisporiella thermophila]|uniref:uncharacterized protein n=1 Tax=Calcarisporiella thermophila TaxID=911321 RepID=UPI0037444453